MMTKKILCGILVGASIIGTTVGVYAASTYASCSISKGGMWSESSSVGVGTSATFNGTNYSSSNGSLTMEVYCAWTGWPYTKENSSRIPVGRSASIIEAQSRNSNFYVALSSNGDCNGLGSVQVN